MIETSQSLDIKLGYHRFAFHPSLCGVNKTWLTVAMMAAGTNKLVPDFTSLSSLLLKKAC